jgi:hypothetical protein
MSSVKRARSILLSAGHLQRRVVADQRLPGKIVAEIDSYDLFITIA